MQWYAVLNEKILNKDKIDGKLDCIWLRWHRIAGNYECSSPNKEYALTAAENHREAVHNVERNLRHSHFSLDVCQKVVTEKFFTEGPGRFLEIYNVNRLFK